MGKPGLEAGRCATATLLATVDNVADAEVAGRAGAQRVAIEIGRDARSDRLLAAAPPAGVPRSLLVPSGDGVDLDPERLARCAANWGADELRIPFAEIGRFGAGFRPDLSWIGVVEFDRPIPENLAADAAIAGLRGIMLAGSRRTSIRVLDTLSMPTLAALVLACHAEGLGVSISGALELPDVPRLLALRPDELGFDRALREGGHPDGRVDPSRVRAVRELMDLSGRGGAETGDRSSHPAEPDRIFVRDWILSIGIGAYAREREAPQRVRLSVEAEIARQSAKAADLRDVVSYDLITDAIRRLVADHVDLVETLAESIADAVLSHPRVLGVTVTVEKLDLGPGAVGCRLVRRRPPR